jgi:hypothetical protein
MRIALIVLMWIAAVVALAAPSYLTSLELSHDNGYIFGQYAYYNGAGCYAAVQFEAPSGGPWYLNGIKYYVWVGWPDQIFQGFGVGCWKMESGTPGALVWPEDGVVMYNPNTAGNWIVQPVDPNFNLAQNCPDGFVVGIDFLYSNPYCDAFGIDDTGPGAYDWAYYNGVWDAGPYGKGSARALVNDIGNPGVETTTLGQMRALYK